jgi:3-methyladenine DNA glycosylase Tag
MTPAWDVEKPRDDTEYFERLTKFIFSAGLNWSMIERKWPSFREAFVDFSPGKVAKFSSKAVKALMNDARIVRNEKKITATVHNAAEFVKLQKEFGSFQGYVDSFGKDDERLMTDVQERFQHLGHSTARMFLWSAGCELTPTAEETKWMAGHKPGK